MKVLVIGGGGREHALCWALARSGDVACAPGNPGTAELGLNIPLDPTDHDAVAAAVAEHQFDLTVIGPEAPLAAGLVDHLKADGRTVFGPTARAARIEASKVYAKRIMHDAGVPTAEALSFSDVAPALDYIEGHPEPLVVKASGLAAGKGAIVCDTRAEARDAAREILAGRFGAAGDQILVEEYLEGEELSVLALTDGERAVLLPSSQDHKRLGEGDSGPNTGGMGAYAPVSIADPDLISWIQDRVIEPVLGCMAESGAPYEGVLYAGLMIPTSGTPKVLEFNCRFGDPEAQVVLPLLGFDLREHLWRIAARERWDPPTVDSAALGAAVTTVLASPGYPASPSTGSAIGIPTVLPDHALLFHAGTTRDSAGVLRTSGGRVLCATGLGADVPTAASRSRALAEVISFENKVYRRDIAWREMARAGAA